MNRISARVPRVNAPGLWVALAWLIAGCATAPPDEPEDLCAIFREKPGWYRAVVKAEKRWNIPAHVMMSVTYRESSYVSNAKPARGKLLWVIPWKRPSSAYGYAQATDATWSDYERATGRRFADRDDFDDAIDFIGWYLNRAHRHLGISTNNARHLYLAYHEGLSGYKSGRWKKNKWLLGAADKVANKAWHYQRQLHACRGKLKKKKRFWVF